MPISKPIVKLINNKADKPAIVVNALEKIGIKERSKAFFALSIAEKFSFLKLL